MPSHECLDQLDRYLEAIDKKILAGGGQTWDCLSPPERATITAYFLALEISNGGIEQFFINPAGDRWRETHDALKTVGATRLADLFEEALSVFPNGRPSTDQLTRCHQYEEAGGHAEQLLLKLTNAYYDLQEEGPADCLYEILTEFAIKQLANEQNGGA